MEFLNRESLLKKRARRTKVVELPELDGKVTIRAMSEGERSRYEASFLDKDGKPRLSSIEAARRRLIVLSVVDESGNLMLTADDVAALEGTDAAAMSRVYNEAREISGFEERDIEELTGNWNAPSGDVQPSGLPASVGDGTSTN